MTQPPAWVRVRGLVVQLSQVLAIETRLHASAGADGCRLARPVVTLYLALPSPHDGLPWVLTADGAEAFALARLAERLADPAGCAGGEQGLRDGGLGDMACGVDAGPPPF